MCGIVSFQTSPAQRQDAQNVGQPNSLRLHSPSTPEVNWQQNQTRCLQGVTHLTQRTWEEEQGLPPPQIPTCRAAKAILTAAEGHIYTLLWLMVSPDLLFVYGTMSLNCAGLLVESRESREICYGINQIKSIQCITWIKQTAYSVFHLI